MKDMSSWSVTPLGAVDMEEVSDSRMGTRRRNSNDNLFEILPQLFIRPSDNVNESGDSIQLTRKLPKRVMCAAGGGDTIGLVLDSELLVLEKTYEYEKAKRIAFGCPIDFILWRRSIILVGLSSSEIVLIDPNTYEVKESKKLSAAVDLKNGAEHFFVDAAIHSNPDPTKIDVIAVGCTGAIYLFNNISLSDGTLDSTHDQNVSVDIDLGSIKGSKITSLFNENSKLLCAASPSRNILILGEENGTLTMHDIEDFMGAQKEFTISNEVNLISDFGLTNSTCIKKIVNFEGLLFVLLSNGSLAILLNEVLFPTDPFKLHDDSLIIHDFALVLTGESEVKLWVIYGNPDLSSEENYIGIFSGPSFDPEFSVKIPSMSDDRGKNGSKFIFPSQATPFEEPFAFLEISEFGTKVYRMLETSTEATIQKLLARGKFDQAISLSIQYGKDLDIVYKAQARAKFNEILGSNDNKKTSIIKANMFETLIDTLEKIKDAIFVCSFCCQGGVPNISWIKRLLGVGKARVIDCSSTQAGKNLLLTIKKFYTFEQVFHDATMEEWVAFASIENTMFQQCQWFLNKHDFEKCERVWKRHFDEFISEISLNDFAPFFFILFGQKLSSPNAVSLFKCILPYAVEKCADSNSSEATLGDDIQLDDAQRNRVIVLVEFAKRQVCFLERERAWPSEATEFSKIVIAVVQEIMERLSEGRNRYERNTLIQKFICQEILYKMEALVQSLTELADLKQHHSIRIPFQDYINNDVIEVVNSMLYELFQRDEVERFINNFLVPFAQRKRIEIDNLFFEHIKAVVSDLPFHINPLDIPHEERLICLINFISSPEIKLQSVLKIAAEWPVPWSTNIDNIVVACIRMSVRGDRTCTDLQKTINLMRVQVPFRCLLNKYRLTASKVQNYSGVVMAITRIIRTGKPEYFADCQELIKHTGKADDTKIKFIEFSLNLKDLNFPVEKLVSPTLEKGLLKQLLARTLQEFRMGDMNKQFSEEEVKRIVDVSKIIANILDNKKVIEFLKLREFIPSLQNCDIVYEDEYPFCVLNYIMTDCADKSSEIVMQQCKKLGNITFTHFNDILVAAASFYTRTGGPKSDLAKAWDIVAEIVKSSSTSSCSWGRGYCNKMAEQFVYTTANEVTQFLMCNIPDASDNQLGILHDFIVMLARFDDLTTDVSKILGSYQVFWALREQEIPLEKEFLQVYRWMYVEGVPWRPPAGPDEFMKYLQRFGATILKFGDKDLFKQAFGCIQKEFLSRMFGREEEILAAKTLAKGILKLQKDLYAAFDTFAEPETDKCVLELVECLKREAGISVTPYALRQRNKSRFLEKLLSVNHFSLAAQVAITFEVFTDYDAWSKILQGFIGLSDVNELRKVLRDLRNVSELWMLPEFADGWRKVSSVDSGFLDLCPIPLD